LQTEEELEEEVEDVVDREAGEASAAGVAEVVEEDSRLSFCKEGSGGGLVGWEYQLVLSVNSINFRHQDLGLDS
jgi:hypothetical protein